MSNKSMAGPPPREPAQKTSTSNRVRAFADRFVFGEHGLASLTRLVCEAELDRVKAEYRRLDPLAQAGVLGVVEGGSAAICLDPRTQNHVKANLEDIRQALRTVLHMG